MKNILIALAILLLLLSCSKSAEKEARIKIEKEGNCRKIIHDHISSNKHKLTQSPVNFCRTLTSDVRVKFYKLDTFIPTSVCKDCDMNQFNEICFDEYQKYSKYLIGAYDLKGSSKPIGKIGDIGGDFNPDAFILKESDLKELDLKFATISGVQKKKIIENETGKRITNK